MSTQPPCGQRPHNSLGVDYRSFSFTCPPPIIKTGALRLENVCPHLAMPQRTVFPGRYVHSGPVFVMVSIALNSTAHTLNSWIGGVSGCPWLLSAPPQSVLPKFQAISVLSVALIICTLLELIPDLWQYRGLFDPFAFAASQSHNTGESSSKSYCGRSLSRNFSCSLSAFVRPSF